jgi:hypothetical protein
MDQLILDILIWVHTINGWKIKQIGTEYPSCPINKELRLGWLEHLPPQKYQPDGRKINKRGKDNVQHASTDKEAIFYFSAYQCDAFALPIDFTSVQRR